MSGFDVSLFSDPYLESITACGILREPDDDLKAKVGNQQLCVHAKYATNAGTDVWLRFICNWQDSPPGIHVHIDASRKPYQNQPRDESSNGQFIEALSTFANHDVAFNLYSRFSVERSKLKKESVINLLLNVSVGPPNSEARLTGAKFSLAAGAVDELRWEARKKNEEDVVRAYADSNSTTKVTSDLFAAVFPPLKTAFYTLILEEGVE
jgi:hypothetical protein